VDNFTQNFSMPVGLLTLHLHLPGCTSLKEKRSQIKPLVARLHREFNIAAAEMDLLDRWQESVITCAALGNEPAHVQRVLQSVVAFTESHFADIEIVDHRIEML
jgi:uncharacterized protein YlxP (DUF503 family)